MQCISFQFIVFNFIYFLICYSDLDFSLVRDVYAMTDGNTFTTANDDIVNCEHRTSQRIPVADCADFANSPVNCNFCDQVALNGSEGVSAVVCGGCGVTICEDCNAPNSDSDKDSGLGEE